MKGKNFIIPLVVYSFDVMCSFGETDAQVANALNKYKVDFQDTAWKFESNSVLGRTVVFDSGQTLIRLPKIPTTSEEYGTLAHEIFHAVEFLFARIRITHSIECGEAYAYLIGYLTTEIYKRL